MACATRVQKHCHLFGTTKAKLYTTAVRTGHGNTVLENAVARKHQPQTPHQQNTRTQTNKGNAMFGNALAEQEQRAEAAKMRQGNPVAKSSQGNPGRLESQQPKNQRQQS